jgi:tetratricopeptide (TPR) repeat protein
MVSFWCTNCGKTINANDKDAGKKCKCRGCGKINTIPVPQSAKPATETKTAPARTPKPPPPRPKSPPTAPIITEVISVQNTTSEAKATLPPSKKVKKQQEMRMGKSELIGIGVGVVAVVLVVGFILQQFLWKDTWEIDNQDAIMRIRDEAISSFESKGYESALAKNNELLALIGDRNLEHPELIKAVSETKAVAEKVIKARQTLSEQMLSKLEIQAKASTEKHDLAKALKIYDDALSFARTVESKGPAFIAITSKITKARNAISERIAQEREANAHLNQADEHLKKKRYEDTIVSCKKALAIKPDLSMAYLHMGTAYNMLEKYADAIAALKQVISLKPDSAEAYYNMGFAYNNLKKYSEAITAYKTTVALKPDYAKAYLLMGIPYKNLLQYSDAIDAYRKYIVLKPTGDLADDARKIIRLLSKEKNETAAFLKRETTTVSKNQTVLVLCHKCAGSGKKSEKERSYEASARSSMIVGNSITRIRINPACQECRGNGTLSIPGTQYERELAYAQRKLADSVCQQLKANGYIRSAVFVGYFWGLRHSRSPLLSSSIGPSKTCVRYVFEFVTKAGFVRKYDRGYIVLQRINGQWQTVIVNIDGLTENTY